MSLDDFVLFTDAVELGVPAITYAIKFFEIFGYVSIHKQDLSFEQQTKEAYVRTKNYFKAYKEECQ